MTNAHIRQLLIHPQNPTLQNELFTAVIVCCSLIITLPFRFSSSIPGSFPFHTVCLHAKAPPAAAFLQPEVLFFNVRIQRNPSDNE